MKTYSVKTRKHIEHRARVYRARGVFARTIVPARKRTLSSYKDAILLSVCTVTCVVVSAIAWGMP